MFQNDVLGEDISSITLEHYEDPKPNRTCQLPCNSLVLFILLGFLFVIVGVMKLIGYDNTEHVHFDLQKIGNTWKNSGNQYVAFASSRSVGIYLTVNTVTQFKHSGLYKKHGNLALQGDLCGQYRTNRDMNKTTAVNGAALSPQEQAIPCGKHAAMFPVGTLNITYQNGTTLVVETQDLTVFDYDIKNGDLSKQWVNLQSQVFQSWMQANANIMATKLIGRLPSNFEGLLQVSITMQNGLAQQIKQLKLSLADDGAFLGRNFEFCLLNFIFSISLFLFSFSLFYYKKIIDRSIEKNKRESHVISVKISKSQQEKGDKAI